MLNYAVDPHLLQHLVPRGTELDQFEGRTYISLVGFRFERIRIRGIRIPWHSNFDEVNLRFYVRRTHEDESRRGVVFVREIVPLWAVAKVAQLTFHEKYISLPMEHRLVAPLNNGPASAEFRWRFDRQWNSLRVDYEGEPSFAAEGSLAQFITEHYWGYASRPDGSALEYRVQHPRWRVWTAVRSQLEGDMRKLYGPDLARCLDREPTSAFMAEGSVVSVYPGTPLR